MTTSATAEPMPSRGRTGAAPHAFARVRGRVETSDALLFLYLLVFARQFLWVFESNALAWALSVPLAAVALYFYVRTKPFTRERTGRETRDHSDAAHDGDEAGRNGDDGGR